MSQGRLADMRHLAIGVFHDETLGRELGKKGTLSDIAMYNRKTNECIFTFMSPVEDKLSAKSQIISSIDGAVLVFSGMSRELGETILMLDLAGVQDGIAVTTPYVTSEQVASVIDSTSVKSFGLERKDPGRLLELLSEINPLRDNASPAVIVVDHSFSVKGVGEVLLGFVKRGVVKKYDELNLLPAGKKVAVRSIQVQDEDQDTANAGTRVGLAIEGATTEELTRGSILTGSNQIKALSRIKLSFSQSPFYTDKVRDGAFHVTVGMQTNAVTVTNVNDGSVVIVSKNPIVHEPNDVFLLLDLNGKKTRIMGKGVSC
jgi:selenocysteine-specific translation elongation factor